MTCVPAIERSNSSTYLAGIYTGITTIKRMTTLGSNLNTNPEPKIMEVNDGDYSNAILRYLLTLRS